MQNSVGDTLNLTQEAQGNYRPKHRMGKDNGDDSGVVWHGGLVMSLDSEDTHH